MADDAHILSARASDQLLSAVGEQLGLLREHYDLVLIGGAALLALGLVSRPTRDVDVVALADRGGGGKHEADLRALEPTRDELIAAARWSRTHDPSAAHRDILTEALDYLGVEDADLGS